MRAEKSVQRMTRPRQRGERDPVLSVVAPLQSPLGDRRRADELHRGGAGEGERVGAKRLRELELHPRLVRAVGKAERHRLAEVAVGEERGIDLPGRGGDSRACLRHAHVALGDAEREHARVGVVRRVRLVRARHRHGQRAAQPRVGREVERRSVRHALERPVVRRRCGSLPMNRRGPSIVVSLHTIFFMACAGFTHGPPVSLHPPLAAIVISRPRPLALPRRRAGTRPSTPASSTRADSRRTGACRASRRTSASHRCRRAPSTRDRR